MKQNDWTSLMRHRLADREVPVPDDLWDKIEARLGDGDTAANTHVHAPHDGGTRRVVVARMALWAVSAAAAVALLVVMGYHANEDTIRHLAGNRSAAVVRQGNGAAVTSVGGAAVSGGEPLLACGSGAKAAVCGGVAVNVVAGENAAAAAAVPAADSVSCQQVVSTSAGGGVQRVAAGKNARKEPLPPMGSFAGGAARHGSTARFTVGLHTGGAMSDSRSSGYPARRALKASALFAADGFFVQDNQEGSVSSMNVALLSKYMETKHHAQPLSVGVSVGYSLGERLSLTSGVVYTRAVTDFIKSSGDDDVVETQKLHYIGVPLAMKYRVWGNHRVQAYATAGGEADFNVAATMKAGDVTVDADRDRVQFSVNAAAGVQLNVVPQVGVYVEPGVKYYFDNKSQVETIFKDKPWAFSLGVGLRVDL